MWTESLTYKSDGLHSGFWRLNQNDEGVANPEISDIVGIAARIEPHARPGDMLVSETFVRHAIHAETDPIKEGINDIDSEYFESRIYSAEKGLLISKPGKEEEERIKMSVIRIAVY